MGSEQLELLQKAIMDRQEHNTNDAKFVPYTWLAELLTKDQIRRVLDGTRIDEDERPSVAAAVHASGRRIFAILVLMGEPGLVYNFIQLDQYVNKDNLDNRLPMRKKELKEVFEVTRLKEELAKFMKGKEPTEYKRDPEYKRLNQLISERVEWAGIFKSTQYMFLSPTFPQRTPHRIIYDYMRLPFLRREHEAPRVEKKPARGHFGSVFKERLPPLKYGGANDEGMTLVRKELKSVGDEAYKGELRCLRLLNPIQHSSILELYGSYTHEKKHSFLFREATGGDLHDLLGNETRPAEFQDDEAFYLAICGLASALDQLHDYSNDDLKLKMIGCHHDLKPRNVLVDRGKFILADFGLSTMTDAKEDPKMLSQNRDLYFAAPEGMDYLTLDKYEVGPPADIWSLGCILAVVFTYMKRGPGGVEEFGDRRRVPVAGELMDIELKAFHDGYGNINPGVVSWLANMEKEAVNKSTEETKSPATGTLADVDLIHLIRDMLLINPSARPKTKEVLSRLRCLTLKKASEPIKEDLDKSYHASNLEFAVERQVFLEWLGRIDATRKKDHQFVPSDEVFAQVHASLRGIKDELKILADAENEHPLFARLRRFNEQLLSCLDMTSRRSLRRVVELNIIPAAKELVTQSWLEDWLMIDTDAASEPVVSKMGPKKEGPNSNLLTLLAAGRVRQLMKTSKSHIPKLDRKDVAFYPITSPQVRTCRFGTLASSPESSAMEVIVEEMDISLDYANPDVSLLLFDNLENVLSLPRASTAFRALNCSGIYHDADASMIGLVYRYPDAAVAAAAANGTRPRAVQLAELLKKHEDPTDYENNFIVSIDERFRLAYDLATAVFEFHKIGWLHKNISSFNILFFTTNDEDEGNPNPNNSNSDSDNHVAPINPTAPPRKLSLRSPSLIGFSHSRPDGKFSNKMYSTETVLYAFHHPNYGGVDGKFTPYRVEYDYYSLGLVLLEVGLWWPLETIMERIDPELDRRRRRDELLNLVPFLAGAMGEVYTEVVRVCLSDKLCEGVGTVNGNFESMVITPLEAYLAKTVDH